MTIDLAALRILATFAAEQRLPRSLCFAIFYGESGGDVWAVNEVPPDMSYGGIQVNTNAHGHDQAYWSGYDGLERSLRTMGQRWRTTFQRLGDGWTDADAEGKALYLDVFWSAAQGADPERVTMAECRRAVTAALAADAVYEPTKEPMVMRFNPMDGRMGLWLRQMSDTGEGNLDAILDTMRDYGGFNLLCPKVADGMTWQGQINPATPIRSVDDILVMKATCEARGVALCPVVVPRGRDIAGEAALHGMIARNLGCLMTDIEPYPGFWDQSPTARIPEYTRALRQAAGDAYLINQPDPREQAVKDTRVIETAADFDAMCAQHYVGWESVGWTNVDIEVERFHRLNTEGLDMYVTLYGTERIDLAGAFWERVHDDAGGFHCFALGSMNADQLRAFGGLSRPMPVEPQPEPEPVVSIEQIQIGLIDKVLRQDWQALKADVMKLAG